MPEWLSILIRQATQLPPARQAVLALTGLGSLAFFVWIAQSAGEADYKLLYRGLAETESAKVIDGLTAERIAYRLEEGGTAVYVPGLRVHEARIRLAGKGLPAGGGAGFEIFDRPGFGVTDFVNRVNYRRALQGELARSIEQIDAVERARVQVAIPERAGFALSGGVRRVRRSSQLRGGRDLATEQVRGIEYLIASVVEGLDAKNVSVIDLGRCCRGAGDSRPAAHPRARGARTRRGSSRTASSILERTVGVGRVVARVRANDWTQSEKTEERLIPRRRWRAASRRRPNARATGKAARAAFRRGRMRPGRAVPALMTALHSARRPSEQDHELRDQQGDEPRSRRGASSA